MKGILILSSLMGFQACYSKSTGFPVPAPQIELLSGKVRDTDLPIEEKDEFAPGFCYPVQSGNVIRTYLLENIGEYDNLIQIPQDYRISLKDFMVEDFREIFIDAFNNTPANAIFRGEVKSINPGNGYVVIKMDAPRGFHIAYEGLENITVIEGQTVNCGEAIGFLGLISKKEGFLEDNSQKEKQYEAVLRMGRFANFK